MAVLWELLLSHEEGRPLPGARCGLGAVVRLWKETCQEARRCVSWPFTRQSLDFLRERSILAPRPVGMRQCGEFGCLLRSPLPFSCFEKSFQLVFLFSLR